MATGRAKAPSSTFFYVVMFASPISRLFSNSQQRRQTRTDANPCPLLTPNAWSKSFHSKDCGASVGEQSHCAKTPWRHLRRSCSHQRQAHFNGHCCKQHVPPLAHHTLPSFHPKVSPMYPQEYKTLSTSLGMPPLQSMSVSPYLLDRIALTSFSTTKLLSPPGSQTSWQEPSH